MHKCGVRRATPFPYSQTFVAAQLRRRAGGTVPNVRLVSTRLRVLSIGCIGDGWYGARTQYHSCAYRSPIRQLSVALPLRGRVRGAAFQLSVLPVSQVHQDVVTVCRRILSSGCSRRGRRGARNVPAYHCCLSGVPRHGHDTRSSASDTLI